MTSHAKAKESGTPNKAPERIWLQSCGEKDCELPFGDHSEVTWCAEQIDEADAEYIRADLAALLLSAAEELLACKPVMWRRCFDPFGAREWEYTDIEPEGEPDWEALIVLPINLKAAIEAVKGEVK